MTIRLIALLLLGMAAHSVSPGTKYTLDNEQVIYSFVTQSGKIMTLCRDAADTYIIYRFGTKEEIELEFPKKDKDSWTKFTYSYYLKGGGASNEGMELNYVAFTNGGFKYVLYNTYYAIGEEQAIGIRVFDTKGMEVADLKGDLKTQQGTLVNLRDNELIKTGDELYD